MSSWKRTLALGFLFFVLFVFAFALITVGAIIHMQLVPFELRESSCTLTKREVLECNGNWIVAWNGHIFDHVYAFRGSQELADNNLDDYDLNRTYPCLCGQPVITNTGCNPWIGACYLNINATRGVEFTQGIFKYGSDTLISVGCLMFLFCSLTIVILSCRRGGSKKEEPVEADFIRMPKD